MELRKPLLLACGILACVMMGAAVAYACVPFKGDLLIEAPGGNGDLVTGDNDTPAHGYCSGGGGHPTVAASIQGGQSVTVKVNAGTGCNSLGTNKLSSGNKSVIINNATSDGTSPFSYNGSTYVFISGTGCFFNPAPAGNKTLSTAFSVNSGGGATGTFSLPTMNRVDSASYASALCVGTSGNPGIFAPIKITQV